MELWDLYDRDRRPLGRLHERGKPLAEGEYHLSVHIAIFSTDGRMLIQRRTDDRLSWGGLWDISAAGSVTAGENSAEGAHRELFEELGLDRDFTDNRPRFSINYRGGFGDYYFIIEDVDLADVVPQPTEVAEVRYATREEIHELLDEDKFIPYHPGFIDFLFDMRAGYTTHRK